MNRAAWLAVTVTFSATAYSAALAEDGSTPVRNDTQVPPAPPAQPAGQPPPGAPAAVQRVGVDEQLGQMLPLDSDFVDERGRPVRLRDYFRDGKPVIVAPAYFRCVTLCDMLQRDLAYGLRHTPLTLGQDYRVVTVSMDPRDTPKTAALKQQGYLESNRLFDKAAGWPFLTGAAAPIRAVLDRLGYRYAYDQQTDQYAHPAVVAIATGDGRIARYLYGIQFSPRDLRLGLLEAGQGRIGGVVDRVLLTCFHYDPSMRRYGVYVFGVLKIGGAVVALLVAGMIMVLWRIDRRRRRASP